MKHSIDGVERIAGGPARLTAGRAAFVRPAPAVEPEAPAPPTAPAVTPAPPAEPAVVPAVPEAPAPAPLVAAPAPRAGRPPIVPGPGSADSLSLDGLRRQAPPSHRPPAAAPPACRPPETPDDVFPLASKSTTRISRQPAPRLAPAERSAQIRPPSPPSQLPRRPSNSARKVAPRSAMRQTHRRRAHGAVLAAAAAFLILLVGSAWAGASVHNLLAATKTPRPAATINTSSKLAAATPKPAPTPTGAVLGAATPEPASQSQAQLQALVNAFAANQSAQFGIVVTDLKNNISASYQPDLQLPSASLYKLYVADVIYQTLDAGSLTYSSDSGYPGRTIEYCLSLMITISDNDCGDALGDITGWEKQNQQLQATGFRDTDMKIEPQTSAHDVALLLQLLYMNRLNSPDTNQRFLSLLKSQKVNNRLPQGLPSGTVIAHKTGDLDGFVHDAGIVYGPKTDYVVAVMSGPWPAPALAPASFVDLSRQLWDFFEK